MFSSASLSPSGVKFFFSLAFILLSHLFSGFSQHDNRRCVMVQLKPLQSNRQNKNNPGSVNSKNSGRVTQYFSPIAALLFYLKAAIHIPNKTYKISIFFPLFLP
jgi:hypothetical protein